MLLESVKMWEVLEKSKKELTKTVKASDYDYTIEIDKGATVTITRDNDGSYSSLSEKSITFNARDWDKIKQSIDELMDKEV